MIINEQKIKIGYLGSVTGNVNERAAIELLKNNEIKEKEVNVFSHNYTKYNIDGWNYFVFKMEDRIDIYKSIPFVKNDDVYQWSERVLRNKVNNLWCTIVRGKFKFNITVYLENNYVHINITDTSYFGHPFEHIWLKNGATNEDITKAIKDWYDDFLADFNKSHDLWK